MVVSRSHSVANWGVGKAKFNMQTFYKCRERETPPMVQPQNNCHLNPLYDCTVYEAHLSLQSSMTASKHHKTYDLASSTQFYVEAMVIDKFHM